MFNKSVKELKSVTTSAGSYANLNIINHFIITEYPGRSEKEKTLKHCADYNHHWR